MGDTSFVKYNHRILSINKGNSPDVLTESITVPSFRGYSAGEVIPAGTKLIDIINKEFKSTAPTHTVTITVVGSGTTVPAAGSTSVIEGNSFTMTSATPASGWNLDSVKLDGASVTLPYVIPNVTGDKTFVVTFVEAPAVTHTITASAGTGGSISPSGAVSVTDGGSKTFTITADSGKVIKDVKVDGTSVGAVSTYTFSNVTADHTIAAEFENAPVTAHTVTGTAGSNGSIAPSGAQSVADGGSISFTATPASGYVVDKWQLDGADQSETGTTFTVSNVTADHTVNVLFKAAPVEQYHVVIADATSGLSGYGTISPAAGTHDVNVGSSQVVVATPSAGFKIKSFKVDSTEQAIADPTTAFSYTVSGIAADATVNIIVEFEQIPSGAIYNQAYTPGNGRVWQEPTAELVVVGSPMADPDTAVTQIKAGTFAWKSKLQSKSAETFLIAKTLARITSIKANGTDEVLDHSVFDEKSLTIDGVDYWCYYNKGLGGGGNNYVMKGE